MPTTKVEFGLYWKGKKKLRMTFFFYGSHALFTGLTSTEKHKSNFKIGSHSTIHTFKNYFVTVFSIFNNKRYIQTDPKDFANLGVYNGAQTSK